MLEPIMDSLDKQRVVLASSSPRRKDILRQIGLKFEIIPSNYEEDLNPDNFATPSDFAVATAVNKVNEVHEQLIAKSETYDVLIGVDTIVHMNGKVYGKPKDEEEAFKVLKLFSGNCHTVYSGVCIRTPNKVVTFSEGTKVYFGDITDKVIEAYVKSGDPLDKAGGYGIQVKGGSFIQKIEGDYFNVVGLPLYSFCKHLLEIYTGEDQKNIL
ncbi:hypothetical protein RUM43_009179 [Polyplax serrata]|uniref:Uncharacterized protein n=1 Tax=Polyplax serrata TaxID=468196 RepID=A0AAN8S8F5_POLSC